MSAFKVWSEIIGFLNKNMKLKNKEYKFIKSNIIHNLPPFPYCVVSPGVVDKDNDGYGVGGITTFNKKDKQNVKVEHLKQLQSNFGLTFYSDTMEDCLEFLNDTKVLLETQNSLSENYDIILLECTPTIDKSTFLETEFLYKWGFDIRVRTIDIISNEINAIEDVDLN